MNCFYGNNCFTTCLPSQIFHKIKSLPQIIKITAKYLELCRKHVVAALNRKRMKKRMVNKKLEHILLNNTAFQLFKL